MIEASPTSLRLLVYNNTGNLLDTISLIKGQSPAPDILPMAPSGLVAKAVEGGKVSLTWRRAALATTYTVKRATTSKGPYTTVKAGIDTPAFIDDTVTVGKLYFYVVSTVNAKGESANSAPARSYRAE